MDVHHKRAEPWTVTLVDTGDESMTGGRLLRVKDYLADEDHADEALAPRTATTQRRCREA